MRTPVRPYVTVGIALAGAAVLVANPIVPAPADIRVPADGQPVELTAITNPPVLGAILLQIQRNQINDAIEIRNGLTTGAILILNPLLATPGVLAAALAEDVQNGEFEAFPAAIVGQTGAIGLGITRSIEVALPPILASAVSNIADTVEVSLAFPGEAAAIGGTVIQVPLTLVNGVVEAGTAVVQTVVAGEFAQVPAVAAAGVATVVQETTSDVEDVVDQIGTSQDNILGLVRRDPSSTQDAGPLHAQAREGMQTEDATPPLKPRSLVRNSFKAVVGGSNATAKADGAADRATRVTAPGERLQSAVNEVQQRVKQAVDNVSKRVSGEKPSNESGSENADE